MQLATLAQEVRQPMRHINQFASGGSYVAVFTLRLTPAHDISDVRFSSEVNKTEVEPWIVDAIEKGVRQFVAERERNGKPIGSLRVALVDIYVHPVDSKASAFMRAAIMAMTQAFETHETLVEVGYGT